VKTPKVHYTVAAEQDLIAVSNYTALVWGDEQCDFYLNLLEETCEHIIPAHLRLARAVPGYAQLSSWRVEHHAVYFKRVRDGLEIVRILHERQLPARHLKR
jgi:toxin ParE1/3/4